MASRSIEWRATRRSGFGRSASSPKWIRPIDISACIFMDRTKNSKVAGGSGIFPGMLCVQITHNFSVYMRLCVQFPVAHLDHPAQRDNIRADHELSLVPELRPGSGTFSCPRSPLRLPLSYSFICWLSAALPHGIRLSMALSRRS